MSKAADIIAKGVEVTQALAQWIRRLRDRRRKTATQVLDEHGELRTSAAKQRAHEAAQRILEEQGRGGDG